MSNSNNPYPDLSTQPLIKAQPPPPPRSNNPQYAPYNQQGYPGANQTFPAYFPPPSYNPPQQQPNQGFIPNNQGFQPKNQGFPPNGPNGQLHCPFCGRWTESFPKKVAGGVTYVWCLALFLLTGVFCCIPFCVYGCQDTQHRCYA